MSNYKKWVTAGVILSIVGILTGCGNVNNLIGGSTPTKTTNYTAPVGAINNESIGYGYAQVITKPFPLGIRVDVVAPQNMAQSIVQNVTVSTKLK